MADIKSKLLSKLEELKQRYVALEAQLHEPAVISNHARMIEISKEQKKLRDVVSRYDSFQQVQTQIAQAKAMLEDSASDTDLKSLAEQEISELTAKSQQLFEQIQEALVMGDDEQIGSVIIEIRAGTGGDEAALFARDIYEMYLRYAEKHGWKVEQMDFSANDLGGFREVIMNIKGPGVWSHFGYEGGGHRVQRVPQTETQGRIHTSAVTVAVLPEPEELEIEINPADVVEHVSRAGGPGGQSVNKLNSAVRLEHKPTGIMVFMREEKSQHKNRAKAWRILRSRVYELYQLQERQKRDSARKIMIGSGDRSERIRTYNFPQNRVTDHRINLSLYNLDKIIMGDMEELIDALRQHDKAERLASI